jgi:hypothetical protein
MPVTDIVDSRPSSEIQAMFDQQLKKIFTLIDDQLNKMAQLAPNDHVVRNTEA